MGNFIFIETCAVFNTFTYIINAKFKNNSLDNDNADFNLNTPITMDKAQKVGLSIKKIIIKELGPTS